MNPTHGLCIKCSGPVDCAGVVNSTGRLVGRSCFICNPLDREANVYGRVPVATKVFQFFYCTTCLEEDRKLWSTVSPGKLVEEVLQLFQLHAIPLVGEPLPRQLLISLRAISGEKRTEVFARSTNTRPPQLEIIPKAEACFCGICGPRFER